MNKVLAYGEILWDIIEDNAHLGGAPLNFAAHVRKCGVYSGIISCIGQDDLGIRALEKVNSLEVDTSFILSSTQKTGTVNVVLNNGQPDYDIITDVAYDYIDSQALDHVGISTYNVFYFGTLVQRAPKSYQSLYEILDRHSFELVFYDVNLRKECFNRDNIEQSLGYASVLKINDEEVDIVAQMLFNKSMGFEEFCRQIVEVFSNIKTIIITAGGEGCYLFHNNTLSKIESKPVTVADTVGAGDSFSAAFIASYLMHHDVLQAATAANKVGGFVASQSGAIPDYSEEILSLFS
jgi:fructokinase